MIIKKARARADLAEIALFIGKDSPDSAKRFLDAAEEAFSFLESTPEAGALREYLNPALSGLRLWPIRGFEKHLIFYRSTPAGLEVLRVLHSARDIPSLFQDH